MTGRKKKINIAHLLALFLMVLVIADSANPVFALGLFDEASLNATEDSQVAGDDEKGGRTEVGSDDMKPVTAEQIKDGEYDLEVESDSSMFRIVGARLTVSNGTMSARITLAGKGYSRLYMGTGEEAVAASPDDYSEYEENADGSYSYVVPVSALDQVLDCTAFSKRKEKWYDHNIVFLASSLPEGAIKKGIMQMEIMPIILLFIVFFFVSLVLRMKRNNK